MMPMLWSKNLRAYLRIKALQSKPVIRSSKNCQRSAATFDPASSKPARAVRAIKPIDSCSRGSDSSGSEMDEDRRRVCTATKSD